MTAIPLTSDLIHGAAELETTARGITPHRLPAWVRHQFPDPQLMGAQAQPSGVRLSFTTTARRVELVLHTARSTYVGTTRPRGRVDVAAGGHLIASDELTGGDTVETDLTTGAWTMSQGPDHTTVIDLPERESGAHNTRVDIWLPHNERTEIVALTADAEIHPIPATGPRWVHYGSSISQGSNAASPTGIWPIIAARETGAQLQNLGFSGSALVDPFVGRVIRDLPADVISLKLGINVVNTDAMRLRAFVPAVHGLLDTIRDGHPTTPIILASPIYCGIHEDTPGPGAFDPATLGTDQVRFIATGTPGDTALGRLTLGVIRDALRDLAENRADPNLTYIDGLDLFSSQDEATHPLPDALHPGPDAHRIIGDRFARHLQHAMRLP